MEEGQERDDSVVDDDDEDSVTDTPDLWMTERNEEDTKFVRPSTDAIPTKKYPQSESELSIVQHRKKLFKEIGEVYPGHTDFVTRRPVLPR
jgi:hypothetical protein